MNKEFMRPQFCKNMSIAFLFLSAGSLSLALHRCVTDCGSPYNDFLNAISGVCIGLFLYNLSSYLKRSQK